MACVVMCVGTSLVGRHLVAARQRRKGSLVLALQSLWQLRSCKAVLSRYRALGTECAAKIDQYVEHVGLC